MNTKRPQTTATSFVGAWKLESFTETLRNGRYVEPMGENPQGFLLYTEGGIVSAQLTGSERGEDGFPQRNLRQSVEVRRTLLLTSDTVETSR